MHKPVLDRRYFLPFFAALLLLGLSLNSRAAKVTELYTAEVLVAEQSVSVPPQLARKALEQVVIKVTGRRDVLNFPRLQAVLDDPLPLILKYAYQATTTPMNNGEGHEVIGQLLHIEFSQGLLDERLAAVDIRPLGQTRPGLLVWLVEEQGGVREYLGREDDPVILNTLKNTAQSRGLPVFKPLLDIEDEGALPVSDAWGFFADSIKTASRRYQADAILVGRIFPKAGGWQTQWLLLWGPDVSSFNGAGKSLNSQLDNAMNTVADRLFADFIRPGAGGGEEGILLSLSGVNRIDDYFQIRNYLQQLPAIAAISVEFLASDQLMLRLQVEGSIKQLQSAIGLNPRFVKENSYHPTAIASPDATAPVELNYRWQG